MADPCQHERDWNRLEDAVLSQEKRIAALENNHTETKVYMKQFLDSQDDIKASIKDIQKKLDERPAHPVPPVLVEQLSDKKYSESSILQKLTPQLIDLVKWAIVILGAIVGVKLTL